MAAVLSQFWSQKEQLDKFAQQQGKRGASPLELFPYLESSLDLFASDGGYRAVSGAKPTHEQSKFLLNCARNLAVLTVRNGDGRALRTGLLALIAEDGQLDVRETLLNLALLANSAKKIGLDLDRVFKEIDECCTSETFDIITSFINRPEEKKALAAFGYKEVQRSGGFDYKCEW